MLVFCAAVALVAPCVIVDTLDTPSSTDDGARDEYYDTAHTGTAHADTAVASTATNAPDTGNKLSKSEVRAIRETVMDEWRNKNSELWFGMDPIMRICVRARYLSPDPVWAALGGVYTVEKAIDECLDHYGIPSEIDYE